MTDFWTPTFSPEIFASLFLIPSGPKLVSHTEDISVADVGLNNLFSSFDSILEWLNY